MLAHGSGGKLSHELIERLFRPAFANPALDRGDDAAVLALASQAKAAAGVAPGRWRLAFTTDTYVVKPLFFPGGDIGRLAVCGTVNDLSMMGAKPLYISAGFVLEEGLEMTVLARIVDSMAAAAEEAGVQIVTGDTKVVERGGADGLFINTSGVGLVPDGVEISGARARPNDVVIVSGTIGDHGIAVISQREGLAFQTTIQSDVAPLNNLVANLIEALIQRNERQQTQTVSPKPAPGKEGSPGEQLQAEDFPLHTMRDPTRGGLATTLNEIARQAGVCIILDEAAIPIRPEVLAACDMLGYDPLYVANEGKLVAIVAPEWAAETLNLLRAHPYGKEARIIGRVVPEPAGKVFLKTRIGGTRIVDLLTGELLPRIC